MKIWAYCEECRLRHPIQFDPLLPRDYWHEMTNWNVKHLGHCGVGYKWPERMEKPSWVDRLKSFWRFTGNGKAVKAEPSALSQLLLPSVVGGLSPEDVSGPVIPHAIAAFLPNASVTVAYAATATPTLTLASLAASSTLLAGRESTAIDNGASTKYLDAYAAGNYKAGAANNQAGSILTCVVGARDVTPTWPDVFDGTDSAETVSKQGVFDAVCRVISSIAADNTASQVWPWGGVGVAGFFGGMLPDQWIFFVTQSIQTSTNVWSATEGDHAVRYTGISLTVA